MTSKRSSGKEKSARPTARQERARQHRRRHLARQMVWTGTGLLAALLVLLGVWGWKTQVVSRAAEALADSLFETTADMGLAVRKVALQGRKRTALKDVSEAVALPMGAPILGLSVGDLRERLERLDWVKSAVVARQLPDTVVITLTEREPVALWQQRGRLKVIDEDGRELPLDDLSGLPKLPVLVGEDAPKHAHALLSMLAAQPGLAKRVTAAVRVGGRRWNVRFDNGVEVKLPEENAEGAWEGLAELAARDNLLEKGVTGIDLRLPDRMYLRLPKEPMRKLRGDKES